MHELNRSPRPDMTTGPRDSARQLLHDALSMGLFDITESARMFEHLFDRVESRDRG